MNSIADFLLSQNRVSRPVFRQHLPAFTGATNMSHHSLWHRRRGTASNAAND
jgi:hypothetical protein